MTQSGRPAPAHAHRQLRLTSTTRAIRHALALSAVALALSGSGAALAGTCIVSGPNEVTCNGVFTDDVTNTVPVIDLIPDLTLVVGTDGSTTVDPAAGVDGISSTWGGDATVISYADISTNGADGIFMYSTGSVTAENYGSIETYVSQSGANGIEADARGDVDVINGGSVDAYGDFYTVVAISASSYLGDVNVGNSGDISATSTYVNAFGVYVQATNGSASVDNSGTISAYGGNYATGIDVNAINATVDVDNSGYIHTVSGNGNSSGFVATSHESVYASNEGEIVAVSAYDDAWGVFASAWYGSVEAVNSGTISAYGAGFSTGLDVRGLIDADAYAGNSGSIHVEAGSGSGNGIFASAATTGEVYVLNSGYIYVSGDTFATGLNARSVDGDILVVNEGELAVYADVNASGIRGRSDGTGAIDLENSGTISATSASTGVGIYALAVGSGDVYVANAGEIDAIGDSYALGVNINTNGGDIVLVNSGSVYAYSVGAAFGLESASYGATGDVAVYNSGDVSANSVYGIAVAAHANVIGGDFYLYNEQALTASSVYGSAFGVQAFVGGTYASATVVNVGSIDASSTYGTATGVQLVANGEYGVVALDNSGTISAASGDAATGVNLVANGFYGEVTADNSGSIDVQSTYGDATGISATSTGKYGTIAVDNSGTISVRGYYGSATGIYAETFGKYSYSTTVDNSGSIDAYAYGASTATAVGIHTSGDHVYVNQSGAVYAHAYAADASYATAAQESGKYDATFNGADTSTTDAYAGSYTYASATGVDIGAYAAYVTNYGEISAVASADMAYGAAYAYGVSAGAYTAYITLGDTSDISATASGYYARAVGVDASARNLYFSNAGSISADATGYYFANAVGASLNAYNALTGYNSVYNSGTIAATASGVYATATGLRATSATGGISVYNSGDITASGDYYSTGIDLNSYYAGGYGAYVYNSGLISATGGAYNVAVDSRDTAYVDIVNYGTITGAIWSSDGDDSLYNGDGGVWNPGTTPTDLGAGDDSIVNYGTINMDDSVIHMGTYSVYGNYFLNAGVINVNGTGNWIDMGGPQALVPSLNPLPFYNYGVIDFQDGAPNDYLLITGDFAGHGDINVDVSGLNEVSDQLYIDGSVVTGTVQTINVDLLDLPDSIAALIPIVYVSGDSVAGNFVLGDVNWDEDNSFVTLDFGIVADIDASNATPDVFSLGIEVTGLSDVGTLAASVPGAVESLINSGVGTWRQRMGVIDEFNKGAVSLWARVWQDKGTWQPDHVAANFGQLGNFEWDQKNSGAEAGVDFAVTDEFSVGLLVGKSKAKTDLADPGVGHSDIDADTWGLYGTWISPTGFYLDASYRWTSFDVDLGSVAGPMSFSDNAETFNVEVGYAWTLSSGLKIEPQFQYTKTSLDDFDAIDTTSGMSFLNDGGDSSRTRIGVSLRKSFGEADAGWLWTPYVTLSAVHEADGQNTYAINNIFHGETDIGGTSTLLELGFTARHQNWSIYGGLNWEDGGSLTSFFGGQLGVRYTFGGPAPAPAPVVAPPPAKTCADLDDDGDGINNCDDKCLGSTAGEAVGPDGCPVPAPQPEPEPAPKPYRG